MRVSMRKSVCVGLALVSTMIAAEDGLAQDEPKTRILLGPSAGFDYGIVAGGVPVYGGSADCGEFAHGRSYAPSFGGYLLLPSMLSENLHLAARLAFSSTSGEFSAQPIDAQRVFDPETVSLVELQRELRLNSTTQTVGLDLLARYDIGEGLSIGLGPSIGYRLSSEFTPTDNLLGPSGRTFAGGETERPLDGTTPLSSSALAIGAVVSGGYLLPLGGTTSLLPELTLHADLTSPAKESSWQTFSLGVGASLLFDVTPSPEAPPPPPPPVETPRVLALVSRLEMFGIDDDGGRAASAAVKVEEVVHRRHSPLLPIVFFDSASSSLTSRYVRLSPSEVPSFSTNRLGEKDIIGRYRQVLNVVGSRLRSEPGTTITLLGMASSGEEPALSLERAGMVRDYLRDTWGIDDSRFKVKSGAGSTPRSNEATEDGRAENRRVEFISSSSALMEAIVSDDIERDFDPPTLMLAPTVQSEAGVKRWTLTLSQGGNTVEEFSGGSDGQLPSERTWQIQRDRLDTSGRSIDAELVVEDNAGQTSRSTASLPLVLKRRRQVLDSRIASSDGRARLEYSIAGFNYNSSDLNRQNESLIDEIARSIEPDAKITITGYTDRTGSEERNASLSRQRAERIAGAIRARLSARGVKEGSMDAIGAGVETDRFGNDFPEGRMLSRGVSVVVEQGASERDRP